MNNLSGEFENVWGHTYLVSHWVTRFTEEPLSGGILFVALPPCCNRVGALGRGERMGKKYGLEEPN